MPENLSHGKFWCLNTSQKTIKEFGSIQCSSVLLKRGKTFKFWISRMYYLVGNTLLYTSKKKSSVIKGYVDLEYVKCQFKRARSGKKSSILLQHNGITIELCTSKLDVFNMWEEYLRPRVILTDYKEKYQFGEQIGSGSTSKVYRVSHNEHIGSKFAAKVIPTKHLEQDRKSFIVDEIKHLRSLCHPNIMKLYEVHESQEEVCLILELIEGGGLFKQQLKGQQKYSEEESALILRKLLQTLAYMQSKGITHRDIKPENVMFKDPNDLSSLVIIDFGLACTRGSDNYFKVCGTPGYMAPEILNQVYHLPFEMIDVFSLGCVFFEMLTQRPLFYAKTKKDTLKLNMECSIDCTAPEWSQVSTFAKNLLEMMLEKNPTKRITVKEALDSQLFASHVVKSSNFTAVESERDETPRTCDRSVEVVFISSKM